MKSLKVTRGFKRIYLSHINYINISQGRIQEGDEGREGPGPPAAYRMKGLLPNNTINFTKILFYAFFTDKIYNDLITSYIIKY